MHHSFSLGGVIAGLRDATLEDAIAGLILVVDVGGEFTRIAVSPDAWPAPRKLLQIGQYVAVEGRTDSYPFIHGSHQIATAIRLPAESYR